MLKNTKKEEPKTKNVSLFTKPVIVPKDGVKEEEIAAMHRY